MQSPQARKSVENCYNFSIPLWFAPKQSFFCQKKHNTRAFTFVGDIPFFYMKKTKKNLWCQMIFWSFATFFVLTIFQSSAKQRFCFRESMSVLDQNGRIRAQGFLARWQLTSHALYYKIPYLLWILPFWFDFSRFSSSINILRPTAVTFEFFSIISKAVLGRIISVWE